MDDSVFTQHQHKTARQRTSWLAASPSDGQLRFFLHGWPELGLVWRTQAHQQGLDVA